MPRMSKAQFEIELRTQEDARRIMSVIVPDNTPLPDDMTITADCFDRRLLFQIESGRGLQSLAATLEEIMGAVDLCLRTAESL